MAKKYLKSELQQIYKRVDIKKFFDHYKAAVVNSLGNEIRMCCILPGHKDSDPSANFNKVKGMYNCYVCGGRNFFSLVQELENLPNFNVAVDFVKKQVGYDDDDELNRIECLIEDMKDLQTEYDIEEKPKFVEINLNRPEFENAFKHFIKVKKRVSKQMIDLWYLKYAVSGYYKDRLIIPIKYNNKIMSFAARDMSGRSEKWLKMLKQAKRDRLTTTEIAELREKYECKKIVYPPLIDKFEEDQRSDKIIYGTEIKNLLFNFDNAIKIKEYVILVEGAFDAMRLHMWGYNVVALSGTKLSKHNRNLLLSNFDTIYVCLDNDLKDNNENPGQDAARLLVEILEDNIEVYNIILPPGKDPDECNKDEFQDCLDISRLENVIL
jgi:DNA primase